MGNVHNPSMYSKKSNYSLQGLFHYYLQPKTPAKKEKDCLWNAKLRKLSLREKQRSIRITLPSGSYDNKAIIEIINNTIENDSTIQRRNEIRSVHWKICASGTS